MEEGHPLPFGNGERTRREDAVQRFPAAATIAIYSNTCIYLYTVYNIAVRADTPRGSVTRDPDPSHTNGERRRAKAEGRIIMEGNRSEPPA